MNAVIQIENVIYKNPVTSSFQIVTDIGKQTETYGGHRVIVLFSVSLLLCATVVLEQFQFHSFLLTGKKVNLLFNYKL